MTRIYDHDDDFNVYYNPQYQGRNTQYTEYEDNTYEDRVSKLGFMTKYYHGCMKYFKSYILILVFIVMFMILQSTNYIDNFIPSIPYTNIILFQSCYLNKTLFLSITLSFIIVVVH